MIVAILWDNAMIKPFMISTTSLMIYLFQGGRALEDFVKYIAEHATSELKSYDRKGNAKKEDL